MFKTLVFCSLLPSVMLVSRCLVLRVTLTTFCSATRWENANPSYICIRRVLGALVRGTSFKIRPSVYHWCI